LLQTIDESLKDLLENFVHPFLPIKEAAIIHHHPSAELKREEAGDVMVRLEGVALGIPLVDLPEGERDRSSHPEYVDKYPLQAAIYLHRMLIEGQMFIRHDEEPEFGMMACPERFLAVKRARVSYPYDDHLSSFSAEVVIVNRDHIQLLHWVCAGEGAGVVGEEGG